jgi:GT2 family glycosyltransferase
MERMPQTPTDAPARPRVAVVVLSWNRREDTLTCLASLAEATHPLDVVVVDNGSTDGSPDAVAEAFPAAHVVRLDRNTGFSGGVNAGIAAALERGAEAVLLLNNDMTVDPGFVEPLLAALAEPGVAAVCSQILFADEPPRIWYAGAGFRARRGHHGRNVGYGEPPYPPEREPYEVACACGGAMLVSAAAARAVGPFDEGLFAYREDLDWSLRARRLGLRVLVVPASVVHHAVSASSGGASSPASLYYDTRNVLLVGERHAPLRVAGTWLRRLDALGAHLAQAALSRRAAGFGAVLAGFRDALRGRLGERVS